MPSTNEQIFSRQFQELSQEHIQQISSKGQDTASMISKLREKNTDNSVKTHFDGKIDSLKRDFPEVYNSIIRFFQMWSMNDVKRYNDRMIQRMKEYRRNA